MTKIAKLTLIQRFYEEKYPVLREQRVIANGKVNDEDGLYAYFLTWTQQQGDTITSQNCPINQTSMVSMFFELYSDQQVSVKEMVKQWIEERGVIADENSFTSNADMYSDFTEWAGGRTPPVSPNYVGRLIRELMPSLPITGVRKFDRKTRKQIWGLPIKIQEGKPC